MDAVADNPAMRRIAQDRIETVARSLFMLHGLAAPGGDEIGSIVGRAMAGMSAQELRNPDSISSSAIGQIDQLVMSSAEANRRPVNLYSADAARGSRAGEGLGAGIGKSMDALDRLRLVPSSVRYNDLPTGGGSGGSYASERGMGGVPAEFVRAFAGSGVSRDSVRAFAAVGLDRRTFDQFRHEGYSAAQIVENAKDMKVLGGHGKADLAIGQHAPTDLRKASVDVEKEKDPAKKEEKRHHESDVAKKYLALPDSDKRKHGAKEFINWLENHHHHVNLENGPSSAAKLADKSLKSDHVAAGPGISKVQDKNVATFKKQDVAALTKNDDFGEAPDPAPKKPAPVKTAAKPSAVPKPA